MTKKLSPLVARIPHKNLWRDNLTFFQNKNLNRKYIALVLFLKKFFKKEFFIIFKIKPQIRKNFINLQINYYEKSKPTQLFFFKYRGRFKNVLKFKSYFLKKTFFIIKLENLIIKRFNIPVKIRLMRLNKNLKYILNYKRKLINYIYKRFHPLTPRYPRIPFLLKPFKKLLLKSLVLAIYYNNAQLLADILKYSLILKKNRRQFFQVIIRILKNFEPKFFGNMKTIQVIVKGKFFEKSRRTLTHIENFYPDFAKKLNRHDINSRLYTGESLLLTKQGVINIKIFITSVLLESKKLYMSNLIKFENTRKKLKKKIKKKNVQLLFGNFGFIAKENGCVTKNQIESIRKILTKKLLKKNKIWVNLNLIKTLTKKPLASRMGQGKGEPYSNIALIKKGTTLLEFDGLKIKIGLKLLYLIEKKLQIKLVMVARKI